MWPLIKGVDDLIVLFPEYNNSHIPDGDYMYSILATKRYEELQSMIEYARRNRAKKFQEIDDEVVYIKKNIYKEIKSVMVGKCRLFTNYRNIVTKGKATYLLKRSARLGSKRRKATEYELCVESLKVKKLEDEM